MPLLSTGRFFNPAVTVPPGGGGINPTFSNVVFLCGFEGVDGATTATDESPTTPIGMTFAGNAQIDTAQFKFGASSLKLDGAGDIVNFADNADFDFAAGEFTVELWIRFNALAAAAQVFWAQWNNTFGRHSWRFDFTGTTTSNLRFIYKDTGNVQNTVQGSWTPSINTWYHVAVCRAGDTLRIFADGVMVASASMAGKTISNPSQAAWLGAGNNGATEYYNGWMDEWRITKGEGIYNSDAGFAVPTEAFPRS